MADDVDWVAVARRNSRSVQTTVGWIFWDPGAVARFGELGPARSARLHRRPRHPAAARRARRRDRRLRLDQPGGDPLGARPARRARHRPARRVAGPRRGRGRGPARARARRRRPRSRSSGPELWAGRRPAAHRRPRVLRRPPRHGPPRRPAAVGLARRELPAGVAGRHPLGPRRRRRAHRRRGVVPPQRLARLRARLAPDLPGQQPRRDRRRGGPGSRPRVWPTDGVATAEGLALRQRLEDDTDRATTLPWELLGEERSLAFAELLEPPCELLLHRVDVTAGPNYQPASRVRDGRG